MNKVKIKFTDGTTQVIEGEVVEVVLEDLDTTQTWSLKTKDVNGSTENLDFLGGRPDDR